MKLTAHELTGSQNMQVSLSNELQQFVDEKLASGAYATPEDVLQAAVASLRQSEQFGDFAPGELDSLLAEGERSLNDDSAVSAESVSGERKRRSANRRGS